MKIREIAKSLMASIRESITPTIDVTVEFALQYAIPEVPPMTSWEDEGEEVAWNEDWEKEVISQMESGDLRFFRDDIMMTCEDIDFRSYSFGREGPGVGLDAMVRTVITVPRVLVDGMSDDDVTKWLTSGKYDFQWDVPAWEEFSFTPTVTVFDIQR